MDKETFIKLLREGVCGFDKSISTEDGNWVVKGFIDVYKNIYTISSDTKVVSKIIELYIFPKILEFATKNELEIELTKKESEVARYKYEDEKCDEAAKKNREHEIEVAKISSTIKLEVHNV